MADFGRILIIIGLVITFTGIAVLIAIRIFPWLGDLPGDIRVERENFSFYMPLGTMLMVSILASLLLNIILRIFRR